MYLHANSWKNLQARTSSLSIFCEMTTSKAEAAIITTMQVTPSYHRTKKLMNYI
jgi:hypothetical protein